ncbi:MAG: hypothetical protein KJP14_07205 [Eudoraea sp.]|nr:hypothetical protein [Eudoraea sp.]MBT8210297.1 hypothetical protein [Eudoraea sp.]NNK29457.1 hypothetical protein [Flavobacteriaceae bacterium]
MKKFLICILPLLVGSCIPIKIAPEIKDYKIVLAKRFKRDLPRKYAFVFEDEKNADEFYRFLYWKLGRLNTDIEVNLPFNVEGTTYYMSFHERPKRSVVVNLIPLFIDAVLISQDQGAMLEDAYALEGESWYILITVSDSELKDCLMPSHPKQQEVVTTLKTLKDEYENTHHYVEAYLKQEE